MSGNSDIEFNANNSKTSVGNGNENENSDEEEKDNKLGYVEVNKSNCKGVYDDVADDAQQKVGRGNSMTGDAHQKVCKGNSKNNSKCADESDHIIIREQKNSEKESIMENDRKQK